MSVWNAGGGGMAAAALVGAVLVQIPLVAEVGRSSTASARHHTTSPSEKSLPLFLTVKIETVWHGGRH